jgi:hypothetical protein
VWKKIDPAVQPDLEYTTWQKYIGEGVNPSIAGSADGKLAIVYKNETGMVVCAYSSNDGDSWLTSPIATGVYPDIYCYQGKFYASYINAGNLYVVNSTDGGATWGTATKINDQDGTVVAEENAVDINEGGLVWVDNRAGDKDIYYYQLIIPTPKPKLEASVTTGFGLGAKAVVKNTGAAEATNVTWVINVHGGLFDRDLKIATDSIASLAVDAEEPISTGLFFGLGAIIVTVTATCDEGSTATPATADGTQLIIFTIVK